MIRRDEKRGRLGEGVVLGQQARIDVSVRADERKRPSFLVQRAREAADRGLGVEVAILMQDKHGAEGVAGLRRTPGCTILLALRTKSPLARYPST
jgi:hypothetical protein